MLGELLQNLEKVNQHVVATDTGHLKSPLARQTQCHTQAERWLWRGMSCANGTEQRQLSNDLTSLRMARKLQ